MDLRMIVYIEVIHDQTYFAAGDIQKGIKKAIMTFNMCAWCKKSEKEGIWLTHLNYCYE